ncbi:MAG: hypothetical protein LBE82_03700 [Chitinophagaceae bacterium]|jgi:hypothetical protein|nr:hypothetical protein [Chitinophagaceae bacterium]
MQTDTYTETIIPNYSEKWKKEENAYTGNDLIDAYLQGKKAGQDEVFTILSKTFGENMERAMSMSERLYIDAEAKNIKFKNIHLRADGLTKFSALFVAKKDDFISDSFRDIFISARKIKNDEKAADFYISFSFMPDTENLNEDCLNTDGYFMKYER